MSVKTGLDLIAKFWPGRFRDARIGLLVHPASIDRKYRNAVDLFMGFGKARLSALFGPQHGILGQTQDNMVEWEGFHDVRTGTPVFSLYGRNREPESSMLEHVDVIVIDLQDVGSRYYTFIWTMELTMKACSLCEKPVIVLDRPNPIGGKATEGTLLVRDFSSFVGNRPLPVRHGMTIGEIANYLNDMFYPSLDLLVIPMEGWKRHMWFDETKLPWVMPSPNMPTLDTASVYPGMCLLEGTILSEGRGTTRPFEIFGAPFIDPDALVKRLWEFRLRGVVFRSLFFKPTFQKHSGQLCGGVQIHITNREGFMPFKTGVAVLRAVRDLYPEHTLWKDPPYEYERDKMPIDILAGTDRLRRDIDNGESLERMEEWWIDECLQFRRRVRKRYLLYE
jgi:uncharacterized protein YbbC (DUF1343 family)